MLGKIYCLTILWRSTCNSHLIPLRSRVISFIRGSWSLKGYRALRDIEVSVCECVCVCEERKASSVPLTTMFISNGWSVDSWIHFHGGYIGQKCLRHLLRVKYCIFTSKLLIHLNFFFVFFIVLIPIPSNVPFYMYMMF